MEGKKKISILGSTGSIGTQALEVIDKNLENYKVRALSCNGQIDKIESQVIKYRPKYTCIYDDNKYKEAKERLSSYTTVLSGMDGLLQISGDEGTDVVLTSMVGNIGLRPTIEAIKHSKRIALANKETLVTAGEIVMPMAKKYSSEIIPVDSEHSAIFQSLQGNDYNNIKKIILTASGGPFRRNSLEEISQMKASSALKHPNWAMGRKITIDSATLMNKGLEVIEAKWLFDVKVDQIEVVVHPESIIHSMVEYRDSSIIAQLGLPDMRLPIHYAFSYPERMPIDLENLNFFKLKRMNFFEPNMKLFPCLRLALEAISRGGTMPTVLNAGNEILVEAYLNNEIGFYDISGKLEILMEKHENIKNPSLEEILEVDEDIRIRAKEAIR
ncbi:MAG: 1-deoxy-D-xylulose-5-phosphate reductoisomerase [Filifactoraceae bacterium]